jgi:hypothetical protein
MIDYDMWCNIGVSNLPGRYYSAQIKPEILHLLGFLLLPGSYVVVDDSTFFSVISLDINVSISSTGTVCIRILAERHINYDFVGHNQRLSL